MRRIARIIAIVVVLLLVAALSLPFLLNMKQFRPMLEYSLTNALGREVTEPHAPVRFSAIFALGGRGDASAIPALEALLKSEDLSIEMAPTIKEQIARLKKEPGKGPGGADGGEKAEGDSAAMAKRLDRLEHMLQEMSDRLKAIEEKLPAKK